MQNLSMCVRGYLSVKRQGCWPSQSAFRTGQTPPHSLSLSLSKYYLSEADHDDKTPSINLLHSGQWHLGSSMTWITNQLPLCPHECFTSNWRLTSSKSLIVKGGAGTQQAFYQMHLLHVYVHRLSILTCELPTVFLADLTALTAAAKLKYSSLIRCLQHMIYFDVPGPAVENIHGWCHIMETEYSYSSICYIQTHSLLFSLIDFGC